MGAKFVVFWHNIWLIPNYKTCKHSVTNLSLWNLFWYCFTLDLQLFNSFLIRPQPIVEKFKD